MIALLLLSLCGMIQGQRPVWYTGGPCGVSSYSSAGGSGAPDVVPMIVGGEVAQVHQFPWQVSFRWRDYNNKHYCGGSIINERWIITAAHCMDGESVTGTSVVIGDHVMDDPNNPYLKTLYLSSIHMHSHYNKQKISNDIALVKVNETISFNPAVQPICGPEKTYSYANRDAYISGWGTVKYGVTCCPDTLLYANVSIITNTYCAEKFRKHATISDDMICTTDNAQNKERSACQGDSGGPLAVKEADGNYTLVGLVSWGIGCASGYPGVYCRVTKFHQWILETMANNPN